MAWLALPAALAAGLATALALPAAWPPLLPLGRAAAAVVAAAVGAALAALLLSLMASVLPRRLLPGLERRAVLVTGCSSGIGKATALRLDALGVPVLATCRSPEAAGPADLRARASPRLRLLQLDVASDESVRAAADAVRRLLAEEGLELWAVVNNAGVMSVGLTEWLHLADVRSTLETNTLGPVRVAQAFLPLLRRSRGRVVNVLSIASHVSAVGLLPYSMSKYAGLAFTDALRSEMIPFDVSVASVEPWFYSTPMVQDMHDMARRVWGKSPAEVREAYGEGFFTKAVGTSEKIISIFSYSESKVGVVVDDIVDAVLATSPKTRYRPAAMAKVLVLLLWLFPWSMDLLHRVFLPRPQPDAPPPERLASGGARSDRNAEDKQSSVRPEETRVAVG